LDERTETVRAATDVAAGEREEPLLPGDLGRGRWRGHAEPLAGHDELGGGVEAEVADLVEAVGEDVLHKAVEELDRVEGLEVVAAGAEDNAIVGDVEQTAVGDADAMGVTAEVSDDVLGGAEGGLRVDVPGELGHLGDETAEGARVVEGVDMGERPCGVGRAQEGEELAPEQLAHDVLHGEQVASGRVAEALSVEREAAGGDDGVDVGMCCFPGCFVTPHSRFSATAAESFLMLARRRIDLGEVWERGRVDQNGKSSSEARRSAWTARW